MSRIKYYFFYFYSQFTGFPLMIRITVVIVMILLLLYLLTVLKIVNFRYSEEKEIRRKNKIKDRFEVKLKKILYNPKILFKEGIQDILQDGSKKNQTLNKKWQKEHFTELLLSIKENPEKGTELNQNNYVVLLEIFNLTNFWEKKVVSGSTFQKKRALRILDDIELGVSGVSISRQVHSQNEELRKLAKSEYLRFNKNEAFKYLDDGFDKQFNELDGLRLHSILKSKADSMPSIVRWLQRAKDEKYRCFLIKECMFFNQSDSAPYLLELYQQVDSAEIKISIVDALNIFKYQSAVPILANDFNYAPANVQAAIINAMGNFGTPDALKFLIKAYDGVYNNEILINLINNIFKIDKDKQQVLPELKAKANKFTKAALSNAEYYNKENNFYNKTHVASA